jgi:hypothetical protein
MSLEKFADMLQFGVSLKLSGPQEDRYYAQRLRFYVMEQEMFDAESEDDIHIDIYLAGVKTLRVKIKNSTLKFEPLGDGVYDCIMLVLKFIADMHDIVRDDFEREGNIESEFKTQAKPIIEEEDSDDDDWEWI